MIYYYYGIKLYMFVHASIRSADLRVLVSVSLLRSTVPQYLYYGTVLFSFRFVSYSNF